MDAPFHPKRKKWKPLSPPSKIFSFYPISRKSRKLKEDSCWDDVWYHEDSWASKWKKYWVANGLDGRIRCWAEGPDLIGRSVTHHSLRSIEIKTVFLHSEQKIKKNCAYVNNSDLADSLKELSGLIKTHEANGQITCEAQGLAFSLADKTISCLFSSPLQPIAHQLSVELFFPCFK